MQAKQIGGIPFHGYRFWETLVWVPDSMLVTAAKQFPRVLAT